MEVSGLTSCLWVPPGSCSSMPERHKASAAELEQARRKVTALMAEVEEGEEDDDEPQMDEDAGAAPMGAEVEEGDEDDEASDGSMVDLGLPQQGAEGVGAIESDDESEAEDLEIRESDAVFLCCHQRNTGEAALEVFVYDEPQDHVYLHHDITLPAIPLSLAWLPRAGGAEEEGAFAAVGSFLTFIEIWDLDVLDAPEPVLTLGGCKRAEENYISRKLKKQQLKKSSHKDAVLTLAWNPSVKKVLASGSADASVKLWDVNTGDCLETLRHHSAPVQVAQWCPLQPQYLATASFDRTLITVDCRSGARGPSWQLAANPEAVVFSTHQQELLWCTLESGALLHFDARRPGEPVWQCAAHNGEAAGLASNPIVPGLLATAGVDRQVKLWDVRTEPSCIASRDLGQGRVFSMGFNPHKPTLLLAAGDAGKPLVYDTRADVAPAFGG